MKPVREPTVRERAALTRIYGSEENWLNVATQRCRALRISELERRKREKMKLCLKNR